MGLLSARQIVTHPDGSITTRWNWVTLRRWLVLAGVSLAGDGWTYEATVMGSVLQLPAFVSHLGYGADYDYIVPDDVNRWLGPVYTLGQLFGGLIAALICDKFGRRCTLWAGTVLVITAATMLIVSPNSGVVIAGRVIQGISIGFLLLGYQVYAVELASRRDRGFVSTFSLISGNITGFIASIIVYAITYANGDWGWRLAIGISYIPAAMLMVILPFVPESPRWLYLQGREQRAKHVLGRLHGFADGSPTKLQDDFELNEEADEEFRAMTTAIVADQRAGNDKWRAFIANPSARYRLFVSLSSQFWWAWNGSSVLTYYYAQVFTSAGITSTHLVFGVGCILNVMWIFGAIVGGYLLDIIGRRACYTIGLAQMAVFLFAEGGISVQYVDPAINAGTQASQGVGAAWVTLYLCQWTLWVTFFSSAVNLIPAELWPSGLRARGFALSNVVSMAIGFATQYSALPMYRSLNGYVWILFGSVMTLGATIVYLTYPEPKGLVLEEVEILFGSKAGDQVAQITGVPLRKNFAPVQRWLADRRPNSLPSRVIHGEDITGDVPSLARKASDDDSVESPNTKAESPLKE